ncbi:hypothetical protein ANN_14309 [Periplaneta americana]|uniref:Uncharacterized protein n=1 Tax=Periplaneta americana TaxID=6978 RepID=A0ABQ8SXF3_PERAM|nr:hypothetical protein ANN_14309 [Periplaneta americana]
MSPIVTQHLLILGVGKPRKKPQPGNLPRQGIELGPPGFAARRANRYPTDDQAVIATDEDSLQRAIFLLERVTAEHNLQISPSKTKVMAFHGKNIVRAKIVVNNLLIEQVSEVEDDQPKDGMINYTLEPEQISNDLIHEGDDDDDDDDVKNVNILTDPVFNTGRPSLPPDDFGGARFIHSIDDDDDDEEIGGGGGGSGGGDDDDDDNEDCAVKSDKCDIDTKRDEIKYVKADRLRSVADLDAEILLKETARDSYFYMQLRSPHAR